MKVGTRSVRTIYRIGKTAVEAIEMRKSTWAPEGRRIRGRPKETLWKTEEKERTALGFGSWSEATVAAGTL